MRLKGWDFLEHMIEDCEDILAAVQNIDEDKFIQHRNTHKAVLYSLLNLGELMKTFTEADKQERPAIPWKHIIGFRNRASHGYHELNLNIVWDIATNHIAHLLNELQQQKLNSK